MKLTKLMLSAFAAAMALVACNKENATPEVNKELKSVEISLENVVFTKADGGAAVTGKAVQVNNFQIILTDAAGVPYAGKTATGEPAKTYWTQEDLASGVPTTVAYHYVDHRCTRVVVVANLGAEVQNVAAAKKLFSLSEQLNVTDLPLWGDDAELEIVAGHSHEETTQVLKAELTLKPMIARFEIDGFRVKFSNPAKFSTVTVEEVGFSHFYNQAYLGGTWIEESFSTRTDYDNASEIYGWFDSENNNDMWNIDDFDTPLTLTTSSNASNTPYLVAYHFYPSDHIPHLLIRLTADGSPAYLYTANYIHQSQSSSGGTQPTYMTAYDFKPGYVYRMSAVGTVDGSNGFIEFDDDDIDPMQRCIDIQVSVHEWVVDLITPEF